MADAIERAKLVAHWPLDEGVGIDIIDTGPRGATGTLHGDAQWVDRRLVFDGTSFITFGVVPSLEGTAPVTVCAWIKTTCPDEARIIQQRDFNIDGQYYLTLCAGGVVGFHVFGNGTLEASAQSSASVADGNWHHVVAVRDEQSIRIHIDGAEAATATGPIPSLSPTISVTIGSDPRDRSRYFKGSICKVSIYELALTPEHIGVLATQRPR